MSRLFLDTVLYLHSPSTIASDRGYSTHVYISAVLVDGVAMEVIVLANAANGPLLPDGSCVRAVGRAVRVADVVLAKDPALTAIADDDVGQQESLTATMRDLAISADSGRGPTVVGNAKDAVRRRIDVVEATDEVPINNVPAIVL